MKNNNSSLEKKVLKKERKYQKIEQKKSKAQEKFNEATIKAFEKNMSPKYVKKAKKRLDDLKSFQKNLSKILKK